MSKICKLFINENIKTWKKFSTKLAIALVILSLIGTLGFVFIMKYMNENVHVINSTYDWKEQIEREITNLEQTLENGELDEQSKINMQAQLLKCQVALKYEVNIYGNYWKTEVLDKIVEAKLLNEQNTINELINLIEKDDFKGYIEIQKQEQKQEFEDGLITQQEYNDKITILDIKESCEIAKIQNEDYWRRSILNEVQMLQNSVRTGIDYQNRKVLTVEKKQEYEENIKLNIYRLENNMPPVEHANDNYTIMFETLASMFVPAVIAIVAIIIAGGAISTEVSTGTIKFWALTPNRRWKILTAKILSMLFYIIVITLIASVLTVILGSLSFNTPGNEYLYVKNGNVEKIGNMLFIMGYYFAKTIPIIIFALFALMLSTVTRNTSVAVSISVAIYMGNSIAMAIINSYITKDWIKFIPFNNLNIADKIFTNFDNPIGLVTSGSASTSLGFSLGVLAVCAILMLVTMYDSFNKRDII